MLDDTPIDWPSLLRDYRASRGLKQEAAAHDVGVSQATYSRWETGASTPSLAMRNAVFRHARRARSPIDTLDWAETFRRLLAPGIVIAGDTVVSVVNDPLARRLGIPVDDVEGLAFDEAFQGEVVETRARAVEHGVHAGRIASYEACAHAELSPHLARGVSFHVHYVGWPHFTEEDGIAAVEQGVFVSRDDAARIRDRLGGMIRFCASG